MKKLLFIITVIILTIVVSACGNESKRDIKQFERQYKEIHQKQHSVEKVMDKIPLKELDNLSELKQEVRLHIIQMETSLFKQYQTVNHLLHNDKAIAEWFASKKNEIVQHAKKIREYESQKQNLFEKLYKESNLLS